MLESLGYFVRTHITGRVRLRPYPARVEDVAPPIQTEPFYSLVLEACLSRDQREKIQTTWDIGCATWTYLNAVTNAFPNSILFTGVEIDPGRRLTHLYTRGDVATAYALRSNQRGRPTRLLFQDFLEIPMVPQFHAAFCFFFPFVSPNPARAWGLPPRFANFPDLLAQAKRGLGKDCVILSCHQGEWERDLALVAYQKNNLSVQTIAISAKTVQAWWPSPHGTFVCVSRG